MVLDSKASSFLYNFANDASKIFGTASSSAIKDIYGLNTIGNSIGSINMGNIIVEGNADERTVSEIRRAQRDSVDFMLKELNKLKK